MKWTWALLPRFWVSGRTRVNPVTWHLASETVERMARDFAGVLARPGKNPAPLRPDKFWSLFFLGGGMFLPQLQRMKEFLLARSCPRTRFEIHTYVVTSLKTEDREPNRPNIDTWFMLIHFISVGKNLNQLSRLSMVPLVEAKNIQVLYQFVCLTCRTWAPSETLHQTDPRQPSGKFGVRHVCVTKHSKYQFFSDTMLPNRHPNSTS